jgi:hypothetical protein
VTRRSDNFSAGPYDVPHWGEAKVHPDHHIQVLKSLYSLPTRYIGKVVRVRADRRTVRVYVRSELVKTHPRVLPGKRSTDPNDYPQHVRGYAMRSVDALLERAKERGHHVGLLAQRLLGGPLPWTTMRQGYELVRLCDRHGDARVDALCKRALDFDVIDVPRIGRMLKLARWRRACWRGWQTTHAAEHDTALRQVDRTLCHAKGR